LQQALDRAIAPEAADRFDSVADFGRAVVHAAAEPNVAQGAAPAVVVSQLAAQSTPNATRNEDAKLDPPVVRRRAVPWAVATITAVAAIVLVTAVRARHPREQVTLQPDSSSVSATGAAASTTASVTVITPPPGPTKSARVSTSVSHRSTETTSASDLARRIADSVGRSIGSIPLT